MKPALLALSILMVLANPSLGHTDDDFVVDRQSIVAFGPQGGDTFGLESISQKGIVVLLQPRGEDCVLRFPLAIGESIILRSAPAGSDDLVCEASLISINTRQHTKFSAQCTVRPASTEKKCPSTEAGALPR